MLQRAWNPLFSLLGVVSCLCGVIGAALNASLMSTHLRNGARLLGTYNEPVSWNLSNWMSGYNDSTPVQALNIPGTHDSLTWNVPALLSPFVKTQEICVFDQLNYGVRFMDFRIGILNGKINLYHSTYLLDANIQLVDIVWGLYHWLDLHPTETILVSIKIDNGNNTAALQQQVYNIITAPDVSDYWVHNSTHLPTLGQARHKLIPIMRFNINPDNIHVPDYSTVGVTLASGWKDNYPNISITYFEDSYSGVSQKALIEDLYNPAAPNQAMATALKIDAITHHLGLAAAAGQPNGTLAEEWYIAFASGYNGLSTTPEGLALGNSILEVVGINARLLKYLVSHRGSYFGVVLFDFYGDDLRLANATLGWELSSGSIRSIASLTLIVSASALLSSVLLCPG